jgi:hypothetical protein
VVVILLAAVVETTGISCFLQLVRINIEINAENKRLILINFFIITIDKFIKEFNKKRSVDRPIQTYKGTKINNIIQMWYHPVRSVITAGYRVLLPYLLSFLSRTNILFTTSHFSGVSAFDPAFWNCETYSSQSFCCGREPSFFMAFS